MSRFLCAKSLCMSLRQSPRKSLSTFLGTSLGKSAPLLLVCGQSLAADPWADAVVSFVPGIGGSAGFDAPAVTLGPPERFSGEAGGLPAVVSPFSPAWGTDEVLSIGLGGHVVLHFDEPIVDDPANLQGIDLLLFGNSGMVDGAYPAGLCAGIFGADGGVVDVSPDGINWTTLDAQADALWPTMGYTDAGPYDVAPGQSPTDVVRPMPGDAVFEQAMGQAWDAIVTLYDGSAGGTGIDLAPTGLTAVSWVRISVPDDAFLAVEIDAAVDVGRWGDANGDHVITVDDVLAVVADFGATGRTLADRDFDGVVGVSDLLLVLECWP